MINIYNFKKRLRARGYPHNLIEKITSEAKFFKPRTNSNHVKLLSFSEFLASYADGLILSLQSCHKVVTLAISRIFLVLRGEGHFSS